MAVDDLQDHRIETLETRVGVHGKAIDDLTQNVTALSVSVETTNSLLRELLGAVKKGAAAIISVSAVFFGAGQVM